MDLSMLGSFADALDAVDAVDPRYLLFAVEQR
jgi:hypothetical protein